MPLTPAPRAIRLVMVCAALLAACDSASRTTPRERSSSSPTASESALPTPSARSDEDPQVEDARFLVGQMKELHPDLYHSVSRERFNAAARRFIRRAARLSEAEFFVEVMRLVALPTLKGRDGHSGLFPMHGGVPAHAFPIHLYDFSDGLFVVDALPPYKGLIGAEIVSVNETSLDEIRKRLNPLITRDNEFTVKARFPTTFATSEVLQGTGITSGRTAEMRFQYPDGRLTTRRLEPIPMRDYVKWIGQRFLWSVPANNQVLYLSRMRDPQWARYLRSSRTLYLQYNQTHDPFTLMAAIEEYRKEAERIVIDVRHNRGGDNTQYGSLMYELENSRFNRPDRLFLITGRTTFSAAGNFVGEMAHRTKATLVGEASGGSPNQYGDQQVIELPNSGIDAYLSVYYVEVVSDETRAAMPVDIPAPLSSADYFAGRDPALEAIL